MDTAQATTTTAQAWREVQFRGPRGLVTADVIHCPAGEWADRPESRDRDWQALPFGGWVVAIRLTG